MTTKVTVDAHAGWPVKVTKVDKNYQTGEWETTGTEVVPANTVIDFYVYDSRKLIIEEGERS